jgi:hypothetical protein
MDHGAKPGGCKECLDVLERPACSEGDALSRDRAVVFFGKVDVIGE